MASNLKPRSPKIQVERVHGPARRKITQGLREANRLVFGKAQWRPLTITLREGRSIVGGVYGWSFVGWLYIAVLWVSDDLRDRGLGRKLMRRVESEARQQGVKNIFLDTFSFQAPGFYAKLGYREFGRLKNFPVGHRRIYLTKEL